METQYQHQEDSNKKDKRSSTQHQSRNNSNIATTTTTTTTKSSSNNGNGNDNGSNGSSDGGSPRRRRKLRSIIMAILVVVGVLMVLNNQNKLRGFQMTTTTKQQSSSSFSSSSSSSSSTYNNDHHQLVFIPDQYWFQKAKEENFLPLPNDDLQIQRTNNNSKPFSIRIEDFTTTNHRYHNRTDCSTVDELLVAISNGRRVWDENEIMVDKDLLLQLNNKRKNSNSISSSSSGTMTTTMMNDTTSTSTLLLTPNEIQFLYQLEQLPSSFIPYQCTIPIYTSNEICSILNAFSHVLMQGDSLSRHQQGGLIMNLRNNIYNGSIISSNPQMKYCIGDAQFSEDPRCRLNDGFYNHFKPSQLGLCSNLFSNDNNNKQQKQQLQSNNSSNSSSTNLLLQEEEEDDEELDEFESIFNINRLHRGVYNFPGVDCSTSIDDDDDDDDDNTTTTTTQKQNKKKKKRKPILIIVQGGTHMRNHAGLTYNRLLQPFFRNSKVKECMMNPQYKVMFIFISYQAQSISYDTLYKVQSPSIGLQFNTDMKRLVHENHTNLKNIMTMDWYNYTINAMHSDGLHYAAQVNYFKIQHLISLIKFMIQEEKWLQPKVGYRL